MELAIHRKTPDREYDAYRKIIDYAGMVLTAYDPATARRDGASEKARLACNSDVLMIFTFEQIVIKQANKSKCQRKINYFWCKAFFLC